MSESEQSSCGQPGRFSWNELVATDAPAAAKFYGALFGWVTETFSPAGTPAGAPPYLVFKSGPRDEMGVGGLMQAMQPGQPSQWVPYVVVADADASLARATSLGATVLLPVMAVPEVGRVAVIQDPQGAVIGLHELAK